MTPTFYEYDPICCRWLQELFPDGRVYCQDVKQQTFIEGDRVHLFAGVGGWEYALRLAGWESPVWTLSCPCQPFSISGRRTGTSDDRHLWPYARNLIDQHRPATMFGEQVASPLGREWLNGVFNDLEAMGYAVAGADLPSCSVGTSHRRQRLYWAATDARASRLPRLSDIEGVPKSTQTPSTFDGDSITYARFCVGNHCPDVLRVDGLSLKTSRIAIKGYGNGIVPQVAAVFIHAVGESIHDTGAAGL